MNIAGMLTSTTKSVCLFHEMPGYGSVTYFNSVLAAFINQNQDRLPSARATGTPRPLSRLPSTLQPPG